ncbi:hypothetical protein PV326_012848 [Microctonus aethiopoides]|nr:hypothetical protein PV326_012848 [Microctonus aethiopoides]
MMLKDNMWRQRRMAVPKRTSELIALVALSSTLFLFLHTRVLHSRLREMEVRLQPGDNDISGNQLSSVAFTLDTSYMSHISTPICGQIARIDFTPQENRKRRYEDAGNKSVMLC